MKSRSKKGFTLIELMMGVAILLVSGLALLSGFLGSMFLNNSSNNLTTAVNDAQYVLEQVRDLDYTSCIQTGFSGGCYTLPVFRNLPNETVGFKPYPETDIGSSISKVTVEVTWQDNQQTRSFSLATYVAK